MRINDGIMQAAIEEAKKVTTFQFKVGAVVFNKGNIISVGRNYRERSSKRANPIYQNWPTSLHAEHHAILKVNDICELKNKELLVVRINNINNSLCLAKPCSFCMKLVSAVGLKRIYYSIDDNILGIIEKRNFNSSDIIIER